MGLEFGPLFQGIQCGWRGNRESVSIGRLPEGLHAEENDYLFHPALLDACFQLAVLTDRAFDRGLGSLYLPVEIEQLRLFRPAGRSVLVHARLREKTPRRAIADLDIYDEAGLPVAQVRGLHGQRVAGGAEETLDSLLYAYEWHRASVRDPLSVISQNAPSRSWLIFADRGGVGEQLAERLSATGARCTLVAAGTELARRGEGRYEINPGHREDMVQLLQEVLGSTEGACGGIVHLWSLDAPRAEELSTPAIEAAQEAGLLSVLHLVQAWEQVASSRSDEQSCLFLVTRGAQSVGERLEATALAQSPVLGLGRVIVNEYPALRCRLVDLDPVAADVQPLLDELAITDDEDEIALRGFNRFVHRYVALPEGPARQAGPTEAYQVASLSPGTLDGLTPRAMRRRAPGVGEVEIEVAAAGLNFSDIMKALGIYPGLPSGDAPLGAECSGRITAVGAGVEGLDIGDEVVVVAPQSFGSHVTTRAELVARRPLQLSAEEAATLPIAFLTAAHALEELARLGPGEKVLIHSASGGVGLAAVQLARRAGAEIFATAGTPDKRAFLRDLGIEHVMDSRSQEFAEEVLRQTKGRGVDVVLNSLAGEGLIRSLEMLADYGRFLEIGKRDIYANTRLGLRPFRKNLSFFAIDLDRMIRERPAALGTLLRHLMKEVSEGRLTPLRHRVFPVTEVVAAFRYMQQARHIGKIVLSLRQPPTGIATGDEPVCVPADATYLITGGLGGFGLGVARWLVEHGARHLVLLGRRGLHSPESRQAIADLEQRGARVLVRAADVASEAELSGVLAEIDRTLPPLRGVVHAAMVLEDCLLLNLDRERLQRVLAPKVSGAWNLHTLTAGRPLDFFVLFSSLSSVFGHAGQANYAAANAFLDSLAHYRRARGLPALTVNWGYLGNVGYLAERQHLGERLERQGVQSFTVEEALTLLGRLLQRQAIQASVMRIDWTRWRGLGVTGRTSPRFAHLLQAMEDATDQIANGVPTLETVRAADPGERRGLLHALLRDKIARVLGTAPTRLDTERSLLSLGLDSLMAVELRNWVEGELRLSLPIRELLRSPSLSHLADMLLGQLSSDAPQGGQTLLSPPESGRTGVPVSQPTMIDVKDLSGEQIEALVGALRDEQNRNGSS
jgi:NADPH:quinone reductase-like Zn-dependent oxidoreductase/aryl carrier-like protein